MAERKHAEQLLQRLGARDTRTAEPEETDGLTKEHQTNAQAFALSAIFKGCRRKQTFPWSMYAGHEWTDDGDMESLTALFGERALIVRGYRLGELDRDMSLGKRAGLRQHTSKQVEAMLLEDGNEPIIVEIEVFPSFQEMVALLKGEQEK
ncbi:MAG: hypothetical protein ACREIC_17300 [Limisphaerales bacterium]